MAKVIIDEDICVGCGSCIQQCPEAFEYSDEGLSQTKSQECSYCLLEDIADNCPVNAITIED